MKTPAPPPPLTSAPGWVAIGDLDVPGNQITVEAIIRRQDNSNQRNIVSKHTGPGDVNYLLRMGGFALTTSTGFKNCPITNADFSYQVNTWYHVAGTYDGSFMRYYINGCLFKEVAATGTLVVNDLVAAIGTQSNNVDQEHFRGNIDEVRIWNVVRTQKEILNNMNDLPNPTAQIGLMAYYKFSNDLLNAQGNVAWNGTAMGGQAFDVEPPIFPVLSIKNLTVTNASCFEFSDGAILVSAVGPTLTYSINNLTYQTDSLFTGLSAGTYTLYIKNIYGCVESAVDTVKQPDKVPTPTIVVNAPLCTNDTLFLAVDTLLNGTCNWFGPNNYSSQEFDTTLTNISNALNGDYSVYYTFNGCRSDTATKSIFVNPVYHINSDVTICSNEWHTVGNQTFNLAGNYVIPLQTTIGCDSIIYLTLHVNPAYSFVRDTAICAYDTFIYQGQLLNATGTYPFYLKTTLGCDSTITYNLIVYPIPSAPLLTNNSPLLCPGDTYLMLATSLDSGSFAWWGPENFISSADSISFQANISNMGDYYATITVNGCVSPESKVNLDIINIYTLDDFDFPNVITVNGDGSNEKLDLNNYFKTCKEYEMFIYNRWGNLIYQYKQDEAPFQGITNDNKEADAGVYTYRLIYDNGIKSGFFHLIR